MNNHRTLRARVCAVLLVLALCLTILPAAAAADSAQTVYLDSAADFAAFAKSCSLDTWSQGKTFILRADISLSGVDFTPAAAFGGTFNGRGHTISDFNLTQNASPAGLFGTILPGGRVENLNVAGSVAAGGDKIACGGIAGENYGKIVCCTFTGMVQGDTQIGGIVGRNQVSGQIVSCSFEGKVQGTTATGGIAGQNAGIIRHCTNSGSVNIDNVDAALSLSDIQIDTTLDLANLATTQTFLTTTATGGIAGRNTGLIAVCENTGTVGYEHVGYNVGGIAGVTSGYLLNNTNSGTIYGRKDVGGIAGQVEPYVAVTVSESTKQQLQSQLQELKTLTDQATADAGGAASELGAQLAGMGSYLDSAANAANNLRATATIDAGALANGGVSGGADLTVGDASAGIGAGIGAGADGGVSVDAHPLEIEGHKGAGIGAGAGGYIDPSDISISGGTDGSGALSASLQMNADASMPELAGALSGMGAQMRSIGSQAANLSETLQKDVQAVSDKLDEISTTVFDAMDSLENRDLVTDGSQTDPDSITMGALRGCENTGAVQADRNVGGIAGAMGMEAGADPESDVSKSLSSTERKQYELRAVLQRCVSTGAVTAKKDCAAAICGRMDLGLIDGCEAYGSVESQSGDYVGGVAGICSAVIENCWAKCALSGGRYVGGITGTGVTDSVTGSGSTVSGCVSLVSITEYSQYAGAISGSSAGAFADNVFVSDTLAGLDGASAAGQAEPVAYEALLENEALPDEFQTFTVQFIANDTVLKTVAVKYGDSLPDSVYPDIPAVDGQYGEWDVQTLENIQFDTTVTAQYHASIDALPSDAQRADGRPVFLAEGAYTSADRLQAQPQAITPAAFGEISASIPEAIRKYCENIANGHAPAAHVARSVVEQWQLRLPDDGADTHIIRFRSPDGQSGKLDIYLENENGVWQKVPTTEIGSYLSFEASGQTVQLAALSTFPVWWVWIVLAGLAALLVLLIIHLIHKLGKARRRQMQALRKAMQDEQNATDAVIGVIDPEAQEPPASPEQLQKMKKKRRVWWIIALVIVILIAAGIFIYRASLKSSVDALLLLKNLSGRKELDMTASVQMELGDETLRTDVRLFRTQADGNAILCIEDNGVELYYYDGAIYLENGSAYRTSGLFPDYSTLGEHLLELYNATDVTYAREGGEEVYSVTAYGKDAEQTLSLLTPTIADSLSAVESIDLCMHVEDGEIRSIEASGSCQAENSGGQTQPMTVWAELTVQPDAQTAHTVPAAVTDAIANGGYQGKLELTEDLLRVLSAASELGRRDPLAARIRLSANCGPVIFDTSLDYTRTVKDGKTVGCIRAGALELYFSGGSVLSKDGNSPAASEQTLVKCADLIDLAYRACLEDSAASEQTENGWRYTLSLSAEQTKQAACAIAPEAEKLDVQYLPGTLELDVRDGTITALRVTTGGSVQIGVVDTQVSISAQFDFRTDLTADDCSVPAAVLEKL